MDTVTLVFASRAEAGRAEGLIWLKDITDSSPSRRRITIKTEGLTRALSDLALDGFTSVRVDFE